MTSNKEALGNRLEKLFLKHRLVFWYDPKREFEDMLEELELSGVETRKISNNEFGLKVEVFRNHTQKFLFYAPTPCPPPKANWLLDLLLAHTEFRTDATELLLEDLGLGRGFRDLVAAHAAFFKSKDRVQSLREQLQPDDGERQIRLKMMGVVYEVKHPDAETLLFRMFDSFAEEVRDGQGQLGVQDIPGKPGQQLENFGLVSAFWQEVKQSYGYTSNSSSLLDFLLSLFKFSVHSLLKEDPVLNTTVNPLLNHWKDSRQHRDSFTGIAEKMAGPDYLNATKLAEETLDVKQLLELDTFPEFDQRILKEIVKELEQPQAALDVLERWIRQRRESYWQERWGSCYQTCEAATALLRLFEELDLTLSNREEGLQKYVATLHRMDLHYRKFWRHYDQASQNNVFESLGKRLEKRYVNEFLLPLNRRWSELIETPPWQSGVLRSQSSFFENHVQPVLDRSAKLYVVISDALRFESVSELKERVIREDRYTCELEGMLGMLPSYTQLGMAALLPHQTLELGEDANKVMVDGQSSQGLENRKKLLETALPGRATALHVKDFLKLKQPDGRALTKEHDVIYLYHNQVDAAGDDPTTEHRVFEATEDAFEELLKVFKKIMVFNGNHLLLTADHGYLYQRSELQDDDFTELPEASSTPNKVSRRFVIGSDLRDTTNVWTMRAQDLGLNGNHHFQFPRGLQRFRKQGSGMQFVHGGASLQEIVIPVLTIKKKRTSDTEQVRVELLGHTTRITSNLVPLSFYQLEPVEGKRLPRTLRAAFYRTDGRKISEVHEMHFDLNFSDSQQREVKKTFHFIREAGSNVEVILKVESQIPGSEQFTSYFERSFTLSVAFDTDF